jgi:hypothetical protein
MAAILVSRGEISKPLQKGIQSAAKGQSFIKHHGGVAGPAKLVRPLRQGFKANLAEPPEQLWSHLRYSKKKKDPDTSSQCCQ